MPAGLLPFCTTAREALDFIHACDIFVGTLHFFSIFQNTLLFFSDAFNTKQSNFA